MTDDQTEPELDYRALWRDAIGALRILGREVRAWRAKAGQP